MIALLIGVSELIIYKFIVIDLGLPGTEILILWNIHQLDGLKDIKMKPSYYDFHCTARALLWDGKEKESWYYLLLAYADHYEDRHIPARKKSKAQEEGQRLWQQRGTLERLKQNLSAFMTSNDGAARTTEESVAMNVTLNRILSALEFNKRQFATIKSRIADEEKYMTNKQPFHTY